MDGSIDIAAKDNIHRIGGSGIDNLRLRSTDARLTPPGISVLQGPTPTEAARQIREAFPDGTGLHEAARTIGSTNADKIYQAGFEVIPKPTRRLPNHCRIIHADGIAGFTDDNLRRLAAAFHDTIEEES